MKAPNILNINITIITIIIVVTHMIKVTDLAMITPHVGTFDTAQRRVLNLLQNDAFPRFLRSASSFPESFFQTLKPSESNDN